MLKIMADNSVEISAKQDGALYNVALLDSDFIIQGLGEEFAMSQSGLDVIVGTGEAVIHGRHITAQEDNQITLPTNQSGYLVLRIDLSQPIGEEAMLYATPTLTHQEINWNGTIYDMAIATFTTSSTTITNFADVRKTVSKSIDTYTKAETDSKLNGYYTKQQIDAKLGTQVTYSLVGNTLYITTK